MFAPLIHAHSGKQFPDIGVHVPQLEAYSVSNIQSIQHSSIHEVIVGISHGVQTKSKQFKKSSEMEDFLAIAICFEFVFDDCHINFSPQEVLSSSYSTLISTHSPRAPPHITA